MLRTQRPQPEVDFLANSADEAAVRLVQAGGTLLVEPFDIPVGRVAVVADPFGNPLTIVDLSKGRYVTDAHGNVTGVATRLPTLAVMPSDDADPVIRPETADDHQAVREVHTLAFGGGGRIPALVAALRLAPAPLAPMSLVATLGDRVVGHVLLSGCRLDAPHRIVDVLSLSPLGVLPAHQRQGIGTRLIQHALAAADDQGVPLVFLEGSPDFYGRRGFERAGAAGFRSPSLRIPDAVFQVARLSAYEPWMMGTFVYSEPFWALDCVGLREPGT